MITARTIIENRDGVFEVAHHRNRDGECLSFSTGDLCRPGVMVRLHSSCLFGEAFGACDCDCGPQLSSALREIARAGSGVVTYAYEEGRGCGLEAKIRAMELQRLEDLSTYQAYERLGLPHDRRDYAAALAALKDLGVNSRVSLLSNNPIKRSRLEEAGYQIESVVSLPCTVDIRARAYLELKREVAQHTVDLAQVTFVDGRQ